jgi:hypothetical protein
MSDPQIEHEPFEPPTHEVPNPELLMEEPSAGPLTDDEPEDEELAEEWVNDPYAALQAWAEWAKNRGSDAESSRNQLAAGSPNESEGQDDRPTSAGSPPVSPPGTTIRAESQHEFSPYGQLFSEARKSRQP